MMLVSLVASKTALLSSSFLLLTWSLANGHGAGHNTSSSDELMFTGFLADMLCGRLEIAPDAANMLLSPVDHTVRCQLLPNCLRSGYGIIQNIGSDGDNLYRVSTIFDDSGANYVVDLLNSMDQATNDLRVKVHGTVLETADPMETPAIESRDGLRFWPAMNEIPRISLDSLEFCNYQGPDAIFDQSSTCADTESVLELLTTTEGRNTLASANLCFREEIFIASSPEDNAYVVNPSGCADHATFQDVKRADQQTCSQTANPDCDQTCEATDTCALECVDVCGNALVLSSGQVAPACCLDGCGYPIVDGCGFPFLDLCGNAVLADGSPCPEASLAANQVNQCVDGCGSPVTDACGNPVDQCCLDQCGNPQLDPCGFPFLDSCGNPASNADGDTCTTLGANVCLPTKGTDCDTEGQCLTECVDTCGNPLVLSSGQVATACCLDGCGNPIVDECGFPYLDPCGNALLADGTTACPEPSQASNQVNQCIDGCGSPVLDICGNPVEQCCLDQCGSALLDPCGFIFLDRCGNPASNAAGDSCTADRIGGNDCDGNHSGGGGGSAWRKSRKNRELASPIYINQQKSSTGPGRHLQRREDRTKGIRQTSIANHEKIAQSTTLSKNKDRQLAGHEGGGCHKECVDPCGNPLTTDISGALASTCCLNACGDPLLDGCGFPFYDQCGNPTTGYSGDPCPADQIGEYDHNQCIDRCGSPVTDACGSPVSQCCLDQCGNPLLDPCGFPFLDPCGNPASDAAGTVCTTDRLGENACLTGDGGGSCASSCVDGCGNPLVLSSGQVTSTCCLDPCGNALVDPCGFPFLDPCGNPTLADGTTICPSDQVARNDVNQCVDGCGSPIEDACGSPLTQCCLDGCGNPILDPCGFPFLDGCGNPVANADGDVCTTLGTNTCFDNGGDRDTCSPASLFPPAIASFQCEGLVSACTIATAGVSSALQMKCTTRKISRFPHLSLHFLSPHS